MAAALLGSDIDAIATRSRDLISTFKYHSSVSVIFSLEQSDIEYPKITVIE